MIKKLKLQVAERSKAVEVMKNKIAEGCPPIDREQVRRVLNGYRIRYSPCLYRNNYVYVTRLFCLACRLINF